MLCHAKVQAGSGGPTYETSARRETDRRRQYSTFAQGRMVMSCICRLLVMLSRSIASKLFLSQKVVLAFAIRADGTRVRDMPQPATMASAQQTLRVTVPSWNKDPGGGLGTFTQCASCTVIHEKYTYIGQVHCEVRIRGPHLVSRLVLLAGRSRFALVSGRSANETCFSAPLFRMCSYARFTSNCSR